MAGLKHDVADVQFSQCGEKVVRDLFFECELRRQLYKHRTEFVTEPSDGLKELLQCSTAVAQLAGVRNRFLGFHGEAEIVRHRCCPTFPSGPAMRTIKAGIDLHAVETIGISFEGREFCVLRRQREECCLLLQPAVPRKYRTLSVDAERGEAALNSSRHCAYQAQIAFRVKEIDESGTTFLQSLFTWTGVLFNNDQKNLSKRGRISYPIQSPRVLSTAVTSILFTMPPSKAMKAKRLSPGIELPPLWRMTSSSI